MLSRLFVYIFCLFTAFPAFLHAADNPFSEKQGLTSSQDDFLSVEQAYQPDLTFSNNQWQVTWMLADHYFLYKHGFKNEWLAEGKNTDAGVNLPEGIKKTDEYFGEVEIFYQQVQMPLSAPETGTKPVFLKVTAQGCADAGLCYPPYSVYFAVNVANHSATLVTEEEFNKLNIPSTPGEHIRSSKTPSSSPSATSSVPSTSLLWVLISALLGGLILNLMPCVLPVLSIKIMQLARHPDSPQAHKEGLIYMAGVIFSFVAVAAIMLALRAGGAAIGWGIAGWAWANH